jgi:Ca2+-binding RTX toxin-like protein
MARKIGTSGRNKISGTAFNDFIDGRGGNDVIKGKGGHDILKGGSGADVIVGGRGNDLMAGGPQQDIFRFNVGDGQDTVVGYQQGVDKFDVPNFFVPTVTGSVAGSVVTYYDIAGNPAGQFLLAGYFLIPPLGDFF